MGIKRLSSFTKKHDINMLDEVNQRKRNGPNAGLEPIIVIDFKNLTFGVPRRAEVDMYVCMVDICGGISRDILKSWKDMLEALATLDCKLVFFCDLITPMWKAEEWMERKNGISAINEDLYKKIDNKMPLEDIPREFNDFKSLNANYYEMWQIAEEYGDLHFSVENDNDSEIAHYAKQNNAFAVISNDSDFLIYEGKWKLWKLKENKITELIAIEFDRENLLEKLHLPRYKMPLFATLAGNDYTKNHKFLQLVHDILDEQGANHLNVNLKNRYFFGSIADYVRSVPFNVEKRAFDVKKVAIEAFGQEEINKNCQLIKNSVNSYNLDRIPNVMNDLIGKQLLNSPLYPSYLALMYPVVGIPMPFYDMRGRRDGTLLTNLIIEWTSRKKGVLFLNGHNRKPTNYTVLAKRSVNGNFTKSKERIIYPEFHIQPLVGLYLGNNAVLDFEIDEHRWDILKFIMSFSDEEISKIKELPKYYRLICTVLYALVQKDLLNETEADGILFTEHAVYRGTANDRMPNVGDAEHVRSAHIYLIAFPLVRENFAIAGLLSRIQDKLQFNGVYYQQIMNQADRLNDMSSIQNFRIYA